MRKYPYYIYCAANVPIYEHTLPASRILNKLTRVQIISGGFANTILCIGTSYYTTGMYMYYDVRNGGIWLIFISGGDEIASRMTWINYVW